MNFSLLGNRLNTEQAVWLEQAKNVTGNLQNVSIEEIRALKTRQPSFKLTSEIISVLLEKVKLNQLALQEKKIELYRVLSENDPATFAANFDKFEIIDETIRLEFFKNIAAKNSILAMEHFEKFGIVSQRLKEEAATYVSWYNLEACASFFNKFKIDNEDKRLEFFKKIAATNLYLVIDHYEKFELSTEKTLQFIASTHTFMFVDEARRFILFKKLAAKNSYLTMKAFEKFAITLERFKEDAATHIFFYNIYACASGFDKFKIADEGKRLEFFKKIAEKDSLLAMEHFEKFGITSDKLKEEAATHVSWYNIRVCASGFDKFKIADEGKRLEFFKKIAEKDSILAMEHFDKFGIASDKLKEEAATHVSWYNIRVCASRFDKFKIADEGKRLEFFKKIAEKDSLLAMEHFDKFGIASDKLKEEAATHVSWYNIRVCASGFDTFKIADGSKRLELFKAIASKDLLLGVEYYEKFTIQKEETIVSALFETKEFLSFDERKRFEFFKKIASKNSFLAIKHFEKFAITSEKYKEECATHLYFYNIYACAQGFDKFKISSDEKRLDLFRKIASMNFLLVLDNFKKFEIRNEEEVVKFLFMVAEKFPGSCIRLLQDCHVSERVKLELAKIMAKTAPGICLSNIDAFEIANQESMDTIISIISTNHTQFLTGNYQGYLGKNALLRYSLAKKIAELDPSLFIQNFHSFHLENKEVRFEIAKKMARQAPRICAENLLLFGIEELEINKEIARIFIKIDGYAFFKWFTHLKISSDEDKIDLLEMVLNEGSFHSQLLILPYLGSFNIQNEELIYQFLVTCSQKIPHYFNSFSNYILPSNRELDDEYTRVKLSKKHEIEIIKIIFTITDNTAHLLQQIPYFQIDDEKTKEELLKIAITNKNFKIDDILTLLNNSLKITDERVFLDFMKNWWEQYPNQIGFNFSRICFPSENIKVELLKIFHEIWPDIFSCLFHRFNIQNEYEYFQLAKLAVKYELFRYLDLINKLSKEHLLEIVKEYAESFPEDFNTQLNNFQIDIFTEEERLELAKFGSKSENFISNLNHYKTPLTCNYELIKMHLSVPVNKEKFLTLRKELGNLGLSQEQEKEIYAQALAYFSAYDASFYQEEFGEFPLEEANTCLENLPEVSKFIGKEPDDFVKKRLLFSIWYFFSMLEKKGFEKENLISYQSIILQILSYKDPLLRIVFLESFVENSATFKPSQFSSFSKDDPRQTLGTILLSEISSISNQTKDKILKIILKKDYKDTSKQKLLFNFLLEIHKDSVLTKVEKEKLLSLIFQENNAAKQVHRNIKACYDLIVTGNQNCLKEISDKNLDGLEKLLANFFIEKFGIQQNGEFLEKYEKTFGAFRKISSLYRYAGIIHQKCAPNSIERQSLKRLIEDILEGSFYKNRYQSSEHLDLVFKDPAIKEKWMAGSTFSIDPTGTNTKSEKLKKPDFHALLKLKIIQEHHLGQNPEGEYPRLTALLHKEAIDEKDVEIAISDLIQKINNTSPDAASDLQRELDLLSLLLEKTDKVSALKSLCNQFAFNNTFKSDLESFLLFYKNDSNQALFLQIVDTDHPNDLILCGDEVKGSCQATTGTLSNNRGVLGYLLDGKYRMIAIKNANGEILARSMIRLAYDKVLQKPVLIQERVYTRDPNPKFPQILTEACIRKAKDMGISLVSEEGTPSKIKYPNVLSCEKSRAPFEYVDINHIGLVSGTAYEIKDSYVVYDPPEKELLKNK